MFNGSPSPFWILWYLFSAGKWDMGTSLSVLSSLRVSFNSPRISSKKTTFQKKMPMRGSTSLDSPRVNPRSTKGFCSVNREPASCSLEKGTKEPSASLGQSRTNKLLSGKATEEASTSFNSPRMDRQLANRRWSSINRSLLAWNVYLSLRGHSCTS